MKHLRRPAIYTPAPWGERKNKKSPSAPLFSRIDKRGGAAAFAEALNVSEQVVSNWKRRGIPAFELPRVALALGMDVEDYLAEAGRPPQVVRQPSALYLADHEEEMLAAYRSAPADWQAGLRALARAGRDQQIAYLTLMRGREIVGEAQTEPESRAQGTIPQKAGVSSPARSRTKRS